MLESKFLRTICKIAGTLLTLTSLWLTACFGLSISIGMMLGLGVIAFMSAYLPAVLVELSSTPYRNVFRAGIAVAAIVTVIDITTNVSTGGTHKTSDVVQAKVQNIKFEDKRDAVASAKEEIALYEKLISDLTNQNPWTTSVSADGLRGQIQPMEEAIRQEARRGGCGPKCLALKQELAELHNRIAIAEKLDEHTKKLQAARNALSKAIAQAESVEQDVSAVATQNFRLASLFTLSRDPDEGAQHWVDQWLTVLFGVGITFAAQFFNVLGWVSDSRGMAFMERFAAPQRPSAPQVDLTPRTVPAPAPAVSERVVEHQPTIYHIKGADIMDMLRSSAQRARGACAA
jgi:hypothetical protein